MRSLISLYCLGLGTVFGVIVIGDLIGSSILYLFLGEFNSYLGGHINAFSGDFYFLSQENWRVSTGLIGFDEIANGLISLQYTVTGRWIMFLVPGCICAFGMSNYFPKFDYDPNQGPAIWVSLTIGAFLVLSPIAAFAPLLVASLWSLVVFMIEIISRLLLVILSWFT